MADDRRMRFQKNVDEQAHLGAGYKWLFNWIKPYTSNKEILNVGCWTGVFEKLLYKTNCNLTGIDIEEEAVSFSQKKFPRFKFIKASVISPLPFKINSFDVVFFFMTIEHIPKGTEQIALKNIHRVLKKNGILFLSTVNSNPVATFTDPAFYFGHRHYSLEQLEKLLEKAGFEVKEDFVHGGFSIIAYTYLFYFFKHIFRRTFYSKFLNSWMAREYRSRKGFMEIKIRAVKI